ncbi:MAG: hypothetical protein ABW007_19135 [Chitinophagaceae bacterium]
MDFPKFANETDEEFNMRQQAIAAHKRVNDLTPGRHVHHATGEPCDNGNCAINHTHEEHTHSHEEEASKEDPPAVEIVSVEKEAAGPVPLSKPARKRPVSKK